MILEPKLKYCILSSWVWVSQILFFLSESAIMCGSQTGGAIEIPIWIEIERIYFSKPNTSKSIQSKCCSIADVFTACAVCVYWAMKHAITIFGMDICMSGIAWAIYNWILTTPEISRPEQIWLETIYTSSAPMDGEMWTDIHEMIYFHNHYRNY